MRIKWNSGLLVPSVIERGRWCCEAFATSIQKCKQTNTMRRYHNSLRSLLWHRFGKMLSLNSFEISQLVETMPVHNIDIMIIMVARELHG